MHYKWLAIPVSFAAFTLYLYTILRYLPGLHELSDELKLELRFPPRSLEELTNMAKLLTAYQHSHFFYVLLLFCSAYIYKQCFAIPGSVFMNVLAGALFGVTYGFPLVCLLTATGASGCYTLSRCFAQEYIQKWFPGRVSRLQALVQRHLQEGLFFYLLFLRLFPMSPNWFLNMASPVLGVPILHFYFSVLLGLMPYNLVCVQTGSILSTVTSLQEMFSWSVLLRMLLTALVALVPTLVIKRWRKTNDLLEEEKAVMDATEVAEDKSQ